MKVKRIVANVETHDISKAKYFYGEVLGLDQLMDMGFIATYGSHEKMDTQISFASEGGSGTPVPDFSIEVDDLDIALTRIKKAEIPIEYGPIEEPWGVRRFYVKDPFGKLINILSHLWDKRRTNLWEGHNATQLVSRLSGSPNVPSFSRVQTPTLSMDKHIENFSRTVHYSICAKDR